MTQARARIGVDRSLEGRFRWQLSGLLHEETGRLSRPVQTESLLRPDVVRADFKRGYLQYDTSSMLVADTPLRAGLLDEFVRLPDVSDEEILQFAQRRGVLSVMVFRRPGKYVEKFNDWRKWARRARATLDVAASLNLEKAAQESAWMLLDGWWLDVWAQIATKRTDVSQSEARLGAERCQLEDVINRWFVEAELRPYYSDSARGIVFTNVGGVDEGSLTTMGVLAVQLALAASRNRSLAVCSSCGVPYTAARRRAVTQRNYCKKCGIRAAWRDAQADKRAGRNRPRKRAVRGG